VRDEIQDRLDGRFAALPGRGFAAIFTLAAPQARNGPTDIFFARIGPG